MKALNKTDVISLKSDIFFFKVKEGIYIRNNQGYFVINTVEQDKMYDILSKISKKLVLEEILENNNLDELKIIYQLVRILEEKDLIKYVNNQSQKESLNDLYYLIGYYNMDWSKVEKDLEDSSLIIYGDKEISNVINIKLRQTGFKRIYENHDRKIDADTICIYSICSMRDWILAEEVISKGPKYLVLLTMVKERNCIFLVKDIEEFRYLAKYISPCFKMENCNKLSLSKIYSILCLQIIKLLTQCTQSELLTKNYILNTSINKGQFYEIPGRKYVDDNFLKYMKRFEQDGVGKMGPITRGDETQVPLSQWFGVLKLQNEESKRCVGFGDNHKEARINTYLSVIEEYVRDNYITDTNEEVVCCINEDISRYALLKMRLIQYIEKEDTIFQELNAERYSKDIDVEHYMRLLNILNEQIKFQFKVVENGIVIVHIVGMKNEVVNAGYSIKQALINGLRIYIFAIQNGIRCFKGSDINRSFFKYVDGESNKEDVHLIEEDLKMVNIDTIFKYPNLTIKYFKRLE